MQLIIKNLGAIKEGSIDMNKRFYLFVGYNNSGKTYISKLLFTIFHEKTLQGFPNEELVNKLSKNFNKSTITLTPDFLKDLLLGFAQHTKEKFIHSMNLTPEHPTVQNFSIKFDFTDEEIRNHAFKVSSASNIKGKPYSIFSLQKESGVNEVIYEENNFEDQLVDLNEEEKNTFENLIADKKNPTHIHQTLILFLLRSLLRNEKEPIYFPSDRVFYLKHKRSVFSKEYERKKNAESKLQEYISENNGKTIDLKTILQLIKSDFTSAEDVLIQKIVALEERFLDNTLNPSPNYEKLSQELEKIMGGEIVLKKIDLPTNEKEVEYVFRFTLDSKTTEDLSLSITSSAANQLSTIYLIIKYLLKSKPYFLLIDEPEENLHPQNQILLLNVLLEFANMNQNRVLIASHSPLLAEALNNYLYASFLKENNIPTPHEIQNIPFFHLKNSIEIAQIGVYTFSKNGIVEKYDYEKFGINFKTFQYELLKISQIKNILEETIAELTTE